MAIPAFLVAAGKGIVVGGKWIAAFCVKHSAGLATAATIGATALSGSVFEGKKKKVTFGKSESMTAGKYSFRVPQVKVENISKSGQGAPNAKKSYKRKYSK